MSSLEANESSSPIMVKTDGLSRCRGVFVLSNIQGDVDPRPEPALAGGGGDDEVMSACDGYTVTNQPCLSGRSPY